MSKVSIIIPSRNERFLSNTVDDIFKLEPKFAVLDGLKELPLKVFKLKHLMILDFSYNNITIIPDEITKLTKLI